MGMAFEVPFLNLKKYPSKNPSTPLRTKGSGRLQKKN